MPFGFERRESEKGNYLDFHENKHGIDTKAIFEKDGFLHPISFKWEDEEIRVDKVLTVKSGTSLKKGAAGVVFTCSTGSKTYILGFDGERWYINF